MTLIETLAAWEAELPTEDQTLISSMKVQDKLILNVWSETPEGSEARALVEKELIATQNREVYFAAQIRDFITTLRLLLEQPQFTLAG